MGDYKEEQAEELDVLRSIYPDEIEGKILDVGNRD
jgi:hypothetical protein